ncbi:MAG: DNA polymerase III subunit alpha, partial [Anaerolineales bacterium]|nr:DNA polymerase III subunit alpha [Anaerolineales bacterium]
MPVHLRVHSYYSFLRGTSSPEHLAQAAAGCGMPSLALTDHAHLTGAIEFHEACQSAGVRPLLGLELKASLPEVASPAETRPQNGPQAHRLALALLAMNMQGWGNLCRLSSALLGEPAAIASDSLPYERLADANAGLICLTGDLRLANLHNDERQLLLLLQRLSEVFPERLYIELQRQTEADLAHTQRLASLAKRMRLPVVATHDIYTLKPEQAELQRVISAIRLNRKLDDLPAEALAPPQVSFLDPAEMGALFADLPQALDATLEVAGRCQLRLPLDQPRFPQVHPPGDLSPIQALRQMAYSGAERLYGRVDDAIRTRLEHELGVIEEKGYTPLFLIMQDILGFARRADIPTASRGSASSSLVAHCLGITTPDPLRLDLYFERFLNPARATPPDIDTDLCSRRRDDVIRYVVAAYGEDRVAMVGTINRFRSRSALREVAKAYGLPVAEVNKLVDALPYRGWGPSRGGAQARSSPYTELEERYRAPRYQAIFRHALALREAPHHLSIHAGGLVISPGPMTDLAPTMLSNKGIVITQFDLDSIERLGLVKIDLLGIRGLSVLGDVAEGLSKKIPPPAPKRLEVLEAIPQDDAATAQTVRAGRTIGCFQIESPGMRATLREIQASSVDDILVALALYRPGPLTGGLKDAFVRRHLGQEPVAHLHPALGSLLADTYGVILYQEQVLRIAHELAGFSLAEADLLRRAMSHFDPGKQMQTLKEAFLNGAARKHAMPAETAERIWELMAAFAGYGFPKAHAASYAQVAWRSAWCKTHHPAEFMTAVLANWGG